MIESLIYKFIENIGKYNNYTYEQMEQVKYSIKVIIYEALKIIFTILFFSMFGFFKESIIIIFIMSTTKPFIGGYHEYTQIKCFLVTLLLVFFIIYLSKNIILDLKSTLILNLISIFSIYNQAPIINDRMPLTRKELIKRNRLIGLSSVSIFHILSIILFNVSYFSEILVWTLLVQAILMFNKYENRKEEK